jgi:hypothetical protein
MAETLGLKSKIKNNFPDLSYLQNKKTTQQPSDLAVCVVFITMIPV